MLFLCYPKCSTCQKARKWLDEHGIKYTERHIAEKNPTYDELKVIYELTDKINKELQSIFLEAGVILVDFKIEFGKTSDGQIVLADEISPDTARLWDVDTNKKLDKDRFRRDLGDVIAAYEEIYRRLQTIK